MIPRIGNFIYLGKMNREDEKRRIREGEKGRLGEYLIIPCKPVLSVVKK